MRATTQTERRWQSSPAEEDLRRLEVVVREALGELDPALDLPRDDPWRASLDGKVRAYSDDLRHGLAETLALLGVHGDRIDTEAGSGAAWASFLVGALLERANQDITCRSWASIANWLPLLSEAAPDAFLDAVRQGATGDEPVLRGLFTDRDDSPVFGSHSTHTGLLWALENTAWSPDHFGQSIDLLARLAEIDPGGRLSNRPDNSLAEIYCPWHPEISVDIPRRLTVLDAVRKRHSEIAWRLMLSTLPEAHAIHSPTHEPRFRDWKTVPKPVKTIEYLQFISEVEGCSTMQRPHIVGLHCSRSTRNSRPTTGSVCAVLYRFTWPTSQFTTSTPKHSGNA
jgi:hypothetical protein